MNFAITKNRLVIASATATVLFLVVIFAGSSFLRRSAKHKNTPINPELQKLLESNRDEEFLKEQSILLSMEAANQYQKDHPWVRSDRNWIRSTYYSGVMAFYKASEDPRLLEQSIEWSERHQWQVGNTPVGPNALFCGQTYLEINFLKNESRMIAPIVAWVDSGKPTSPTGIANWYHSKGRTYVDSFYAAPTLAMLAKATGEDRYLSLMNSFFWNVYDRLYDQEDSLFYRDDRFVNTPNRNGRKFLWSRGNGWAIASTARVLQYIPESHPDYERYVGLFRDMSKSIAQRQREDGLWNTNLADEDHFPGPETSGTAFFCYAFAWGVNNELLDSEVYIPIAQKAWVALVRTMTPNGKIQWGQLVGDSPVEVRKEDSHEYVTGAFLLAGSEVLKLQRRLETTDANAVSSQATAEKTRNELFTTKKHDRK